MSNLESFRDETRSWLEANCPASVRQPGPVHSGSTKQTFDADIQRWMEVMAERGWTVPSWPTAYGGGGLNREQTEILYEEMARINARMPLVNMGTRMLGPTLLEYGTEEQKQRHLTVIAKGQAAWCQGYSEPGAGSDLAGLRTKAEDTGDHYVINGQKTWTSGAQNADWMFALVRTDPNASKHQGISFMLLPMDQPGVTIKPIQLISGSSPFCETFLDNAVAEKSDLIGTLNDGWGIGKRLLQHERSGQGGLGAGGGVRLPVGVTVNLDVAEVGKTYLGTEQGKIAEPRLRDEILQWRMNDAVLKLTQRRANEESQSGKMPGDVTSVFKLYGSTQARERQDLIVKLMGSSGLGWEGDSFSETELGAARSMFASRAVTIYGGTNEVQANVIAKRVLGLPD